MGRKWVGMSKTKHRVGIVGCGLIGNKRADALKECGCPLSIVADVDSKKAAVLAEKLGCKYSADWREVTRAQDVEIVVVATTNDALAEITIDAIKNGKHVLVEKPAARSVKELEKIIDAHEKNRGVQVKVGFNHRFHPAIQKANEIISSGEIGEVMFVRARYGHGGRPGYEKEWRAFKSKAGGGEMLDQGVHVIDLSRFYLGEEFTKAIGFCGNFFWKMEVEDNCFALLKTAKGQVAQLHASCTQWKNIFSIEIFCKTGQLNIEGLGRSYGKETLTFYKMRLEMGSPDKQVFEWDEPDNSWQKEFESFLESIRKGEEPDGNLYDALAALKIVEEIYAWSEKNG